MEILSVYCEACRSFLAYSSSLNNKIKSKTLVKILFFFCWRPFGIPSFSKFMLNRVIFYCCGRLAVSFRKEMFLYFICLPKVTTKLGKFLVVKYSTTHVSCWLCTERVCKAVITERSPFCDAAGLSQHQTALIIAKKLLIRMPCQMSFILLRNNIVQ